MTMQDKIFEPESGFHPIATKLFIPILRGEIVDRSRLIKRLDAGTSGKLILISAPAGSGKTTLLSDWIARKGITVAWFSIDEEDDDPRQFLAYIIKALQTVRKNIGSEVLAALYSKQFVSVENSVAALINDLTTIQQDLFLVLEDYHSIGNLQIHELVDFFLRHIPPHVHLIIATRSDPLLPLARLRSRNQLTEIRASDLCFSKTETEFYLNRIMRLGLDSDEIGRLESRTEGWAAGLQLTALSLKDRKDIHEFIQRFSGDNHHIVDYLGEEVLNVQSEDVQSFLLQTSILARFNASLCNAVTGRNDAVSMLEDLEKANLFLIPLDNQRRQFRYHHLFSDLLQNQLQIRLADRITELHLRACDWYMQHDMTSEAIRHCLAGGDDEKAAALVEKSFQNRMCCGEDFKTMLWRLEALPERLIHARDSLHVMHAWMLSIVLRLDEIEGHLKEIEEKSQGNLPGDLQRQILHIRAERARHTHHFDEAVSLSQKVLASIPEERSVTDMQNMTGALFNLAWTYWDCGRSEPALQTFSECLNISRAANSQMLILLALRGLGLTRTLRGELRKAAQTYDEGVQLIDKFSMEKGDILPGAVFVYTAYGDLLRERNLLEEAADYLKRGLTLGKQSRFDPKTMRNGWISLARVQGAQNDFTGAMQSLRDAEIYVLNYTAVPDIVVPIQTCEMRLKLMQTEIQSGLLQEIGEWAEQRDFKPDKPIVSIVDETERLILVRYLIQTEQIDLAERHLDLIKQEARSNQRNSSLIEISMLEAIVFNIFGEPETAFRKIDEALKKAESEAYIRLFADEGRPMFDLLEKYIKTYKANASTIQYAETLLTILRNSLAHRNKFDQLDALSDRELDVLRLMETGLSNQKIADRLYISLNTVKTHMKNINSKLNVHNRLEAIACAKAQKLL